MFGVGVAYGAMATSHGFPLWFAPALGVAVLAASAEMMFTAMVIAGTSPILALLSTLLINTRHVPYGFSVSHDLGHDGRKWLRAHLVNDESIAMALAQSSGRARRRALTRTGIAILVTWPLGAAVGGVVGQFVSAASLGLDSAFPVIMLSLLKTRVFDPELRGPLIVGMGGALVASIWLPAQLALFVPLAFIPMIRTDRT